MAESVCLQAVFFILIFQVTTMIDEKFAICVHIIATSSDIDDCLRGP